MRLSRSLNDSLASFAATELGAGLNSKVGGAVLVAVPRVAGSWASLSLGGIDTLTVVSVESNKRAGELPTCVGGGRVDSRSAFFACTRGFDTAERGSGGGSERESDGGSEEGGGGSGGEEGGELVSSTDSPALSPVASFCLDGNLCRTRGRSRVGWLSFGLSTDGECASPLLLGSTSGSARARLLGDGIANGLNP